MKSILAVMFREYKIRTTNLMWLFFDVLVPFAYLLIFGMGFNTALPTGISTHGASVTYNEFFLAGVLSMACFGIAINTSYGFFVDRDNGIFYEFLTYPMTRGQFLIGKITFNCLTSLFQTIIAVGLGAGLLGITLRWEFIGLLLASVMLGTAGWFFFLTIFALKIRRNDVFNTFINVSYFVLLFAASVFYPLDQTPDWFRTISLLNPLTWHTDLLRFLTIGVGNVETIMIETISYCTFMLFSFWIAAKALRRPA